MYVCMFVYLFVCLHPREQALEAKSSLYTRNEGYIEPVLTGELWFKAGNTCLPV